MRKPKTASKTSQAREAREAREREQVLRQENLFLIRQCIADAKNVLHDEKMMDMQSHVLSISIALFKKRAASLQTVTAQAGG